MHKSFEYVKRVEKRLLTRLLAVWTGLEPATSAVTGRHSNQLNYQTKYLIKWWFRAESNHRHEDFQSSALPTELRNHYWRSGRDSNPRPPPWQGGILTNWTTRPITIKMAEIEGFEPPQDVNPLLVFKTSPFSQTWVNLRIK